MTLKTTLTSEEIQKMIDQAQYLRDKVILSFLADTGCRVSELLNLKVDQIDLDNRQAIIRHLKRGTKKRCPDCSRSAGRNTRFCSKCGRNLTRVAPEGIEERSRLISFGSLTSDFLTSYMEDMKPEDSLINLRRQQVYNVVRDTALAIGIEGRAMVNPESSKKHYVHPHSYRDSLAVDWLGYAGTDVSLQQALQEYLGHKDFGTTMRYNKLTPGRVRQISDEVRQMRFSAQAQGKVNAYHSEGSNKG